MAIIHDAWARHLAERALEASIGRVLTASNGFSGLRLIERECPDLIVLEMSLPEVSGWVLLEHVQRRTLPRPGVLLLRDEMLDEPTGPDRGADYGFVDGVIAGPWTQAQLVEQVAWVSDKRLAHRHEAGLANPALCNEVGTTVRQPHGMTVQRL